MLELAERMAPVIRSRLCATAGTRWGTLIKANSVLLFARGLKAEVGDWCEVAGLHAPIACEVVGFDGDLTLLMPLESVRGVGPGQRVSVHPQRGLPDADALLGRIIDACAAPLDGLGEIAGSARAHARLPISPFDRLPIDTSLDVGVRAINGLCRVGVGQRLGLFAGSGVGKSVLLGMMSRFTRADVVVVALIGERGREVTEFVRENLGEGRARTVVVAAPADDSPAKRIRGAWLATDIAEAFRAQGKRVLLLMDSLTRIAQAQREIGLAVGEPAATKGYTPSAFALIPRIVERAGRLGAGSITAFYTVLMEEDDTNDPIVDAARAVLDGHILLSRRMAEQGIYPAIDPTASVSRLMLKLVDAPVRERIEAFKAHWQRYHEQEDLIALGAYQHGADARTDEAIRLHPAMRSYLVQDHLHAAGIAEAELQLKQCLSGPPRDVTEGRPLKPAQAKPDRQQIA